MWGIVTVTQNGLLAAKMLKLQFPDSVIYTLPKWNDKETEPIEGELNIFTGDLFFRHRTIVFIMATGIVVRCIAKHLNDKTVDPAIIVMDEKQKFVISLVSGHLGGANAITNEIAAKLNSTAVITTASDIQGLPSVDMIAKEHNLVIESMEDAKAISAMAVNGDKIAFRNESNISIPFYFELENDTTQGLVIITNKKSIDTNKPVARLIPKNIVIGIGSKRGVSTFDIISFINEQLSIYNINPKSIKCLTSIDIKSDEKGIIEAAAYYNVPNIFIPIAEIEEIETDFTASAFVKTQIGVSAVCEPAAFIAGGKEGRYISKKQSRDGITLAIFESAVNDY